MIDVTKRYIEACENPIRESYVVAKYGLFNKEAKGNIISVTASTNFKPFSITSQTYDEVKDTTIEYISCEETRVRLDGTFAFLQNKDSSNSNQNIGIWSNEMSNSNGSFTSPYQIIYTFNKNIEFIELTMYFQEVISSMDIYYYLDNSLIYTKSIENNNSLVINTHDESVDNSNKFFNKIILSIKSTETGHRYVKLNEIDFGGYQTLNKDDIAELEIIDEISVDSSSMVSNSCQIKIKDLKGEYDFINPYNKLKYLQEKQMLSIYHYLKVGSAYKEVSLGTFLIKDMDYAEKKLIINAYDDRYFMNKTYYGSKFYINEPVKNVLKDLFDYFGYTSDKYIIDDELNDNVINGYIKNVKFSEALRLICESCCAVITKDRYGKTYIFKTYDKPIKLFRNGEYSNASPKKNLYNNVIDVKEYKYIESNEIVELYKGDLSKGTHVIIFDKSPIIYKNYKDNYSLIKGDISNTNYNIISLYATSCVVEVLNDTNVVLQGKVYTSSTTTKRIQKNTLIDVDEYAITSVDNTLINSNNSNDVAMWKLNKSDVKYSFDINSMPYIEVGDMCKIQLPYKSLNGNTINKTFIPTKLKFTLGVKESIEGE